MKPIILLTTVVLLLAGCQSSRPAHEVEMPYNDDLEGVDAERKSPCACVDYSDFINVG